MPLLSSSSLAANSSSIISSNKKSLVAAAVAVVSSAAAVTAYNIYRYRRRKASQSEWQDIEEQKYGHEALHSILEHFKSLALDPETTVEEANKRRTASYYLKAREAHENRVVRGCCNSVGGSREKDRHQHLLELRKNEIDGTMKYYNKGTKSHRTVVVMCDSITANLLDEARLKILEPLNYSTDINTTGVWIPKINIIPTEDLHVTVAIPWWWHTMLSPPNANEELSRGLAARFRQTLVLKFHHPFQIELQRIVLLGGKTLVALWRCVGERLTPDGLYTIFDRHGESVDPFVRLRVEIVRCFTTESPDNRRQPLTYTTQKESSATNDGTTTVPTTPSPAKYLSLETEGETAEASSAILPPPPELPKPEKLERQHTIEKNTPGMLQSDGFIHTTLCRLPLDCMSPHDVDLDKVHRLCREASATLSGHRMVISKFRFLETTGCGGESNPCVEPIYDETIEAPSRVQVDHMGGITGGDTLHMPKGVTSSRSRTIGAVQNYVQPESVFGLFDVGENEEADGATQLKKCERDRGGSVRSITAPVLI